MTPSSAATAYALQVGFRLGHYDVTTLIDEGGMGPVYRPVHPLLAKGVLS